MKPTSESFELIAIPCYGSRVLPRFGQAREFIFVQADVAGSALNEWQRRSWDPSAEPLLVRWLLNERVDTVLCGGIHPRFQLALNAENIQVFWGFRGEVDEVLKQCLESINQQGAKQCRKFP